MTRYANAPGAGVTALHRQPQSDEFAGIAKEGQ